MISPDLSDSHCNKDQGFKEAPHNNPWVGILIDGPMNAVPNLWKVLKIIQEALRNYFNRNIILPAYTLAHASLQLGLCSVPWSCPQACCGTPETEPDLNLLFFTLLTYLLSTLFILGWVTWGFSNVHAEHDNLGGHGRHLVGEAILVDTVHVSRKCILPIGFPFSLGVFSRKTSNIVCIIQCCSWESWICTWWIVLPSGPTILTSMSRKPPSATSNMRPIFVPDFTWNRDVERVSDVKGYLIKKAFFGMSIHCDKISIHTGQQSQTCHQPSY